MKLTLAVKVRILKPVDGNWEEHGKRLRELSWIASRVMNGTMTRLVLSAEHRELVPAEWKSAERPHAAKNKGGKPGAYPMARDAMATANEHRKKPVDGIPATVQLGWARAVERRHRIDYRDVLRGEKSVASYRSPAPICVASGQGAFTVRHGGRGYVLGIPLHSGGAAGRVDFVVAPDGRGAHEHMRRIVGGEATIGDLRILAPRDGRRGWVAMISYSYDALEPAPRLDGPTLILRLASNGGIELAIPGRATRALYDGATLRRQRAAFAWRRASRSRHQRDIGRGARGHGRDRALEHYRAVDDAEARWRKALTQEIAAKATKQALLRGACWVAVAESLASALPLAAMKEALEWALVRAGFVPPKSLAEQSAAGEASS